MANKKLSAVITIGGAVSANLKDAFQTVTRSTSQLGDAVGRLENRQRLLGSAIQRLGRAGMDVDRLREKYKAVTAELERQRALLDRIKRLEEKRKHFADKASQAGGKMRESAVQLGVAAAPVIGSVLKSSEFNYQMQAIGNTADMDRGEIASLGKDIVEISREVGKSIEETQGAMGYLVAAGADVPVARDMLKSIGKAATGTSSEILDVAKAAFVLNDTLKVTPTQMQDALGKLVQAGKEGNFEFKDMAAELPTLGAGFVALKMQGTEAVATMGAALQIARKGAATSGEAANNMSNFVNKILSPETLKKAKKVFNVDLYKIVTNAQKNGGNPIEAAIEAVNKMTKGGDQKLLGELFGDMQVQNFVRPMLQNLDEYKRIKGEVLKAGSDTLERDFASMSDTAKEKMSKASGELGRLANAFGTVLEPAIGDAAAAFNSFMVPVTKWVEENPKTVQSMTAVTVGALAMKTAFFGAKAAAFLVGGKAAAAAISFTKLGVAIKGIGTAIAWAGRLAMAHPAIMALTVGGAAAYAAYENRDKIIQTAKDMFTPDENAPELTPEQIEELSKPAFVSPKVAGRRIAPQPLLPEIPQPKDAASVTTVTDNSQHTYNITQHPGQDPKELAEEIMRLQREATQRQNRGRMADGMGE